MKKVFLILFFGLITNSMNAQYLELAKSILGGLSDNNQEMTMYLRSMDEKISSMEERNMKKDVREKTSPNPLLINSRVMKIAKEKSETILIAKSLVSDIKRISKTKISNPEEVISAIVNISQFTVQSFLQTKKLIVYSGESISTQDKLKVLSDTSEMIEKNKQQLLWVQQQLQNIKN